MATLWASPEDWGFGNRMVLYGGYPVVVASALASSSFPYSSVFRSMVILIWFVFTSLVLTALEYQGKAASRNVLGMHGNEGQIQTRAR